MVSEFQPISPSPLALACAKRQIAEDDRYDRRLIELTGQSDVPADPLDLGSKIHKKAEYYERLLKGSTSNSVLKAVILNEAYQTATISCEMGIPDEFLISEELIPQVARQNGEMLIDSVLSGDNSLLEDDSLREMEVAVLMAEEKGVTVTQIFEDDHQYCDLVRRAHTPYSLIRLGIKLADKMDYQMMEDVMLGKYRALVLASLWSEGTISHMEDDSVKEILDFMIQRVKQDAVVQEQIKSYTKTVKKAFYLIAGEVVERYWGQEALEQLPKQIRNGIRYYRGEP